MTPRFVVLVLDLKKFLKKNWDEKDTQAVMDAKLGNIIKEKLGLNCIYNNGVMELCRGVRLQLHGLISQLHGMCARVG
jgi:nucleolar protein 58